VRGEFPLPKKSLSSLAIATLLALPTPLLNISTALADRRDFRVFNRTGVVMTNLQVSPHGTNSWEEDILGNNVLPVGESMVVRFVDSLDTCEYDMRVKFDGREPIELYGLNVCSTEYYNFHD
jgi:hypothetical protein